MFLKKQIISILIASSIFASTTAGATDLEKLTELPTAAVSFTYGDNTYTRQMEKLDRGLVAVKTDDGVYLSWRLSGEESSVSEIKNAPDFEVYKNDEKIATVTASTNYVDRFGTAEDRYSVAIIGKEQCESVSVWNNNYIDIPMDIPETFVDGETSYPYTVGEASCGDLDGDGQYELVVKWNANVNDNGIPGVTGNVYLDAYELTGEKLWRIDLGRNIRSGLHYTQFLVYDFDLDGYAEVTVKTAPGSIDGEGRYVSEASLIDDIKDVDNTAVYVNDSGYILEGDEFFTVFEGKTGKALDTIYYPNQRISASVWGDDWGNRCDRFLADVAYLDGEKPYAVYWRGYYGASGSFKTRMGIFGARLDENKRLQCDYCFDTYDTSKVANYKGVYGYSDNIYKYTGQGNHNMTVADVDNDGKDEFISGSLCMEVNDNNKLMPKWCSYRGHGDALHIGDYDPTHPGFEYFSVHEGGGYTDTYSGKELDYGMTVYDAATGEELFHKGASRDTGRGVMANIGSGGYYQISGSGNIAAYGNGVFKESSVGPGSNFRVFWDGDLYDELADNINITDWNGSSIVNIFSASGCTVATAGKYTPVLQADLFGDWREEMCFPLSDQSAIRVFITTAVTEYKLPTLMHDPVYRSGVAAEQTAYNQPPHIGFYLSEELFGKSIVSANFTAPDKTAYYIGEEFSMSGMKYTVTYENGKVEDVYDYEVTGYNPMNAGVQEITVKYKEFTNTFNVTVETGFECDENGYITAYNGTHTTEIIPENINGIEITGIAENALNDTVIEKLYVYNNVQDIQTNTFGNAVIYCNGNSSIYQYAKDNNIPYVLLSIDIDSYGIDIDFEESEFAGMRLLLNASPASANIEGVTFAMGARSGGGDGVTGFTAVKEGENTYLSCGAGRFSSSGRNAYIKIDSSVPLVEDLYAALSFDVMFPEAKNTSEEAIAAYISIEDENGVVDRCSVNNMHAEFGKWYNYSIVYLNGEYIRVITDSEGTVMSMTNLGKPDAENGISKLQIYFDEEYADVEYVGARVLIDNFEYHVCKSEKEYGIVYTDYESDFVETVVSTQDTENMVLYIAEYDADGSLLSVELEKIESNYKRNVFEISPSEGSTIKVMLWQGMKPVDCKILV